MAFEISGYKYLKKYASIFELIYDCYRVYQELIYAQSDDINLEFYLVRNKVLDLRFDIRINDFYNNKNQILTII